MFFTFLFTKVKIKNAVFDVLVFEKFNLASGEETKIIDLAKMVNDVTGNKAPIKFLERRKWDTKSRLLASVKKAEKLIGYNPNTPFEEGLRNTVEWFRENWDRIQESARFGPGMSSAVRGIVQEK